MYSSRNLRYMCFQALCSSDLKSGGGGSKKLRRPDLTGTNVVESASVYLSRG